MSKKKYSFVLMNDIGWYKSYRFRPRILIYIGSILALFLCFVVWTFYWNTAQYIKYEEAQNSLIILEKRVLEQRTELERLSNVKLFAQDNKVDKNIQEPLTALSLPKIFEKIDLGVADVGNLKTNFVENSLNFSFDLKNLTETALSGAAELNIYLADASLKELGVQGNNLDFFIQRFKRITGIFLLPNGISYKDIFALQLLIKDEKGKVLFSEVYPLYTLTN